MKHEVLEVVVAPDTNYLPHCAVMLQSLFAIHLPSAVRVHLLHDDGLAAEDRQRLADFVTGHGSRLQQHRISPEQVERLPAHGKYPKTAWYRVLAPQLIDVPRALYLDCDLVVSGSLWPLWQLNLGEQLVAAVGDAMAPDSLTGFHHFIFELGLTRGEDYFNTGVLLMNLQRLRDEGLAERLLDFVIQQSVPMPCADQDAMNAVLRGRRLHLPPRWNLMPPLLLYWYQGSAVPPLQRLRASVAPRVIHYFGEYKPWAATRTHPMRQEYWRHRQQTPWAIAPPALEWDELLLQPLAPRLRVFILGGLRYLKLAVTHPWQYKTYRWGTRYWGGALLNLLPARLAQPLRTAVRKLAPAKANDPTP